MPTRVTRILKTYSILLICAFLLMGASPWSDKPLAADPAAPIEEPVSTQEEIAAEPSPVETKEPSPPPIRPAEEQPKQKAAQEKPVVSRGKPKPATPPAQAKPEPPQETASTLARQQDLNIYVLNAISTYAGGHYPYLLDNNYATYNGVTSNIYYQGHLLLKAHPSGNRASHCVGITFEVFVKAMRARNKAAGLEQDDFNGMSLAAMSDFMLRWYVAGPKDTHNLAVAIEKYGLGRRITSFSSAKTGDFIDFSRSNGTGHAAVLIDWIKRDGEIIGLRYWSSQESTGGISYAEEYFQPHGSIKRDRVYIGRVGPINSYR